MKALNKEQILFIIALVILGAMAYFRMENRYRHKSVPTSRRDMEVTAPLPCAEIQFADASMNFFSREGRNLFAPPRDWLPLENLILDLPPALELQAVAPFTTPSLGAGHFKVYYQLPQEIPFQEEDEAQAEAEESGFLVNESGSIDSEAMDLDSATDEFDAEAELKARYDWLQLKGHSRIYGRILNDNKYDLVDNRESVRFEQVAFKTGKAFGIHVYERERIDDLGFAETVVNRIELAIRRISFHAGNLKKIHEQARWCFSLRGQDERAMDYAVRLARRAIDLDPLSKESYCLLADIQEQNLDFENAVKTLRSAIDRQLNAPGIYFRYGRWLRRYGMDDSAEDAFLQAEKIEPEFADALEARAGLYYDREAYEEALSLYEQAWRSPSRKPERKLQLLLGEARCLLALNRLDEAANKVQRALNLESDQGAAWNVKGAVSMARGDLISAEEAFREAASLSPDQGEYITNLGCVLLEQGAVQGSRERIRDAIRKFEEAADVDPYASARAVASKGFAHECLGEDEEASSAYERAIQIDPEDYYGLYLWGRNLRKHGDSGAAIDSLKYALQRNNKMAEILGELGYASLQAGRDQDAAFYFEEYEKRASAGFRILYLHGLALLKQNRINEAIARLRASVALAGDAPDPYNGLAYALHAMNEIEETLASFSRVVRSFDRESTDVRYEYAQRWMTRIEEHRRKSQWLDAFQRKTIKNDWNLQQRAGAKISLIQNQVVIQGTQRQEQPDERTALRREVSGKIFRVFEADVTSLEGNQARVGIFLGLYISRGVQGMLTKAEVTLALEPNGGMVCKVVDKSQTAMEWVPIELERLPLGEPVRLGIEVIDYDEGRLRLLVNGEPVLDQDVVVKSLKKCSRSLMLGVFTSAPGSRKVHATADNVRVVVRN
ncbi:MAG: tetratricopeptide repeat protein [Planctomycetota bacterium]